MKYPSQLKEKVIVQMMPPVNATVSELSKEFGVAEGTLYAWRKAALASGVAAPGDGKNAEVWTSRSKFAVVLEAASLAEAELAAESRYFCQVRRYREESRTTIYPDQPWQNHRD